MAALAVVGVDALHGSAGAATNEPRFGAYKPSPGAFTSFERWVGRDVGVRKVHMNRDGGWSGWLNPGWLDRYRRRTIAVNLAPFPNSESGAVGGTDRADAAMRRAANGAFDERYVRFAKKLVAAGHENAFLSLGHEFNGRWFPWTAVGNRGRYEAMWRRVVPLMRSVRGERFRFVWNLAGGPGSLDESKLAGIYPGDSNVDVIGVNLYDVHPRIGPWSGDGWRVDRWRNMVDRPNGLAWVRAFAWNHRKPIAFPEWGLVTRSSNPIGGGDNPYFVRKMYEWFRSHNVLFEAYHSSSNPDNDHVIEDHSDFPIAGAMYRSLANR
jgi:hypothetical protein